MKGSKKRKWHKSYTHAVKKLEMFQIIGLRFKKKILKIVVKLLNNYVIHIYLIIILCNA